MPTINGTTSRRTSNYDFYYVYSITNDNANRRHIVNVKAYLKCISWDFETAVSQPWVHINIGGTVYSRPAAGINCNQYALPHTYLLWEKTAYFGYSTAARSVYLRAYTDDLYVGGNGPGVCNAATTISIPAKYSTAGTLNATPFSESKANVVLSGLATAVGYARTVKWYYKRSDAASWVLFDTTTIDATSTTASFTKQVAGLTPGTSYDFRALIYDGTILIVTKTDSTNTFAMSGTFVKRFTTPTYIMFQLAGLEQSPGYNRIAKLFIKKSTETAYVLASELTIANGTGMANFQTPVLIPGTAYDVKLNVYQGTLLLKSFEVSATTSLTTNAIPDVDLHNAVSTPFTNQVRVYWNCLEPKPGTTYKICYKEGVQAQVEGSVITAPPTSGYTDITVGTIAANKTLAITVKSYMTGASGNKETDPINVDIIKTFEWDTVKAQGGECIVTASEWDRLIKCVNAKFTKTLPTIAQGQPFDNELFNDVQDAMGITGNEQANWDTISADELNALRTAVNA